MQDARVWMLKNFPVRFQKPLKPFSVYSRLDALHGTLEWSGCEVARVKPKLQWVFRDIEDAWHVCLLPSRVVARGPVIQPWEQPLSLCFLLHNGLSQQTMSQIKPFFLPSLLLCLTLSGLFYWYLVTERKNISNIENQLCWKNHLVLWVATQQPLSWSSKNLVF